MGEVVKFKPRHEIECERALTTRGLFAPALDSIYPAPEGYHDGLGHPPNADTAPCEMGVTPENNQT